MDKTVLEYNAIDCAVTFEVKEAFWNDLSDGYTDSYNFTERLQQSLMFMMLRGIAVDMDLLEAVKQETLKEIDQTQEELNELCGRYLNANSPKDCMNYFYVEKGIKPYTKTVKVGGKRESKLTIDDKSLQRIAKGTASRKPFPEAALVQKLRGLRKLSGTYLEMNFDEDKRFRCSLKPRGTKFGRLSSSKTIFGTGMNMQNIPYVMKKFFVPDPGYMMWEIDKAKAEWVVVAYASGDPNMIKVVEEGLDPHIHTAFLMTDIDKTIIAEEDEAIGHTTDPFEIEKIRKEHFPQILEAPFYPRNMTIRQCGKKSNHGLNYDEGFRTFALTNEMLESDAKRIIDLYKYKAYPGIPKWHEKIQERLSEDRILYNCFGRKQRFMGMLNDDLYKAAYSFEPQSTVADLVNWGLIRTYEDTGDYSLLNETELLGQVHDSALGQDPYKEGTEENFLKIASGLQKIGEYLDPEMETGGRTFRIDNDLKVGFSSWGTLKAVDIHKPANELAKDLKGIFDEWKATK